MFTDKYVSLDDKVYQVTFAGDRCFGVRVRVDRLRGIHREDFWRNVWDVGPQSKRVQKIIAIARGEK